MIGREPTQTRFNSWLIISGLIAILISIYFIIASIGLLRLNRKAVAIFYSAIGFNTVFLVIRTLVNNTANSSDEFIGLPQLVFKIVIFIILAIIVAISDKSAFGAGVSQSE